MASIPSPIRKWIRRYITGEGSNEIANQSPVQSVNSQTGDVTISTGGGSIPPSQTVTSYSDLPTTDLSEAEIWLVAGEEDVVVSTQLSPVVWRSVSDFTKVASQIPDTLVSRPADDGSFDGNSDARGLRIETSQKWEQIQAKISSNTGSGTTTAYLQKTDQTVIQTVDISSLGAGDIVTFDQANLTDNTKYDILLDADSSTYQYGQYTSASYPYTSNDGNLKMTTGVTGGGSGLQDSIAFSYVDIGNITL